MSKETVMTLTQKEILEEAAWAAHCWIVTEALLNKIQYMCPADISEGIQTAIRNTVPRKHHD